MGNRASTTPPTIPFESDSTAGVSLSAENPSTLSLCAGASALADTLDAEAGADAESDGTPAASITGACAGSVPAFAVHALRLLLTLTFRLCIPEWPLSSLRRTLICSLRPGTEDAPWRPAEKMAASRNNVSPLPLDPELDPDPVEAELEKRELTFKLAAAACHCSFVGGGGAYAYGAARERGRREAITDREKCIVRRVYRYRDCMVSIA